MTRYKIMAVALLVATGILVSLPAQENEAPLSPSGATAMVATSVSVPALTTTLSVSQMFVPALRGVAPWIANPLLLGAHIPMYWSHPGRAIWYTAAGLALPAAGITTMVLSGGDQLLLDLSQSLLNLYGNAMHLSAYDTYMQGRTMLEPSSAFYLPAGDPVLAHRDLDVLATAPFSSTVADPLVWIPSIVAPAALTAYYLVAEYDNAVSVGEAGHGYVGGIETSPVLSGGYELAKNTVDILAISIGEEAYFRGVVYDSLQRAAGSAVAMTVDALLFPLIHIPGDLQSGFRAETMVFNFVWRSAMTLVFDAAYEKGGLPLSVSVHFWSDLVLRMARWWFYGGSVATQ